jgi:hypothetical protein
MLRYCFAARCWEHMNDNGEEHRRFNATGILAPQCVSDSRPVHLNVRERYGLYLPSGIPSFHYSQILLDRAGTSK